MRIILGYIDSDLFEKWMKEVFIPNIGPERPVILILDNHGSHLNPFVTTTADRNGVIMFGLPSHCTSKLQPLDVHFFSFMKDEFKKICTEAQMSKDNIIAKRGDVPRILKHVLSMDKFSEYARASFRKTGIFPFLRMDLLLKRKKCLRKG